MNNRSNVMLAVLMMLFSSMAGCLDSSEDDEWTAMVSTYHVGQLVSAIGGDTIKVEMMSTSNVPVHDYEPAAADIVRLQESDIFFYHGLNLEPWVEATLSSLGDDAPTSVQTHAMPTGEAALDYKSMLIGDLCELLSEGPYESTTLAMGEEEHHEDHDDGHDNESHSNHSDGEDGHEAHEHAEAEETIENPVSCPADTVISIFHLEKGEHVLEFEEDHHEDFNMSVLKMPGGHAHHHGHDEHDDDDHDGGVCHNTTTHENYDLTEADCGAAGHMWMEGEDHDDHEGGVCHNTTTHENYESTESDCETAGHMWMEEHNDYPEIHAHFKAHSLSFPEEMVCYDISTHTVNGSLVSQADCEAAGLMWTSADSGPDDDDDHSDEGGHHEAGYVVVHIEEEGDYGFAVPKDVEFHILADTPKAYEWAGVFAVNSASHTWSMQAVAGDDGALAYADSSMRVVFVPTDSPNEEAMHSSEAIAETMIEGDSCSIVEDSGSITSIAAEGSCFELHVGTGDDSTYTIDTTGLTGISVYAQHVPTEFERDQHYLKDSVGADVEPVAQESSGAHDHGHDEDHGEGEEIDADEGEEEFDYDPHSWLDPLAFKEQAKVVLEALKAAYPSGEDDFTSNAESYMLKLDNLHADFQANLPSDSTCTDTKVIANHNAYSYMAKRYGLQFISITGLDPEGEPAAADIAEAVEEINEEGITVLFVEEFTSISAVDSIVEQTVSETMPNGVAVEYLYTMELPPKDPSDDYISLMRKSMESLKTGLGC